MVRGVFSICVASQTSRPTGTKVRLIVLADCIASGQRSQAVSFPRGLHALFVRSDVLLPMILSSRTTEVAQFSSCIASQPEACHQHLANWQMPPVAVAAMYNHRVHAACEVDEQQARIGRAVLLASAIASHRSSGSKYLQVASAPVR